MGFEREMGDKNRKIFGNVSEFSIKNDRKMHT